MKCLNDDWQIGKDAEATQMPAGEIAGWLVVCVCVFQWLMDEPSSSLEGP